MKNKKNNVYAKHVVLKKKILNVMVGRRGSISLVYSDRTIITFR